jgi:hypothetical protein
MAVVVRPTPNLNPNLNTSPTRGAYSTHLKLLGLCLADFLLLPLSLQRTCSFTIILYSTDVVNKLP